MNTLAAAMVETWPEAAVFIVAIVVIGALVFFKL